MTSLQVFNGVTSEQPRFLHGPTRFIKHRGVAVKEKTWTKVTGLTPPKTSKTGIKPPESFEIGG